MTFDLVAIGDSTVDVLIPIPRLVTYNEDSVHSTGMVRHMGGSSNYLIMASRLGLRVGVIDAIGDDDLGEFYVAGLKTEGIDTTRLIVRRGSKTTGCVVLLTVSGEHAYIGLEGASQTLTPAEIDEEYVVSARALFVSGYPLAEEPISSAVIKALRVAKATGRQVFFDPSPVADTIPTETLLEVVKSSDTLILNDRELSLISSVLGVEEKPSSLIKLGADVVILKMGGDGCLFHTRSGTECYSGFKVDVVDTTGAGDCFDAAVVYGTLRGWQHREIAIFANAVGGIKVGKRGAGRNVPTIEEVRRFLFKHQVLQGLI